jgi:hypothetical protein
MTHLHADTIAALREFPQHLASAIASLDDACMTAHPLAGEWSIAQNVHHLADSHMTSYIRCRLIASEINPPLKPYDQDAWAGFADSQTADVSTSLIILQGLHLRWADFFTNLAENDWERVGSHPELGAVSLQRQLIGYVAHGNEHLDQIARTLAAYRQA